MILFLIFSIMFTPVVYGENSDLFVSAENSRFDNHFSGSMIVEVVVSNPNLNDLDEGKGEPDVTINGKNLRMVQATDGNWYAYFANLNAAKQADQLAFESGTQGVGLDFGIFCDRDTDISVIGIDLSDSDGFAVAGSQGMSDFTNGNASFSQCTGNPLSSELNNVVRKAKSVNSNPNVPSGQIGINANAWPLIQLFSFDNVRIVYNPGGSPITIDLEYDEISNISIEKDRELYPSNSEVFLTINDMQLNQDPTDKDSWTFVINQDEAVFYQAFDSNGRSSSNGNSGLVNLIDNLDQLGFEDNGTFSMTLDSVATLKTNAHQPTLSVNDGTNTYSDIVTFVETQPNSGIFTSYDDNDESVVGIIGNVPRGLTDIIRYNDKSISLLSGSSTASIDSNPVISIGNLQSQWNPGTEMPIYLSDKDQNLNSGSQDDLDLFRSTSILPTLVLGEPITLDSASAVKFYESSTTSLLSGFSVPSSVPDSTSDIFFLETKSSSNSTFEKISIDLGFNTSDLARTLIDPSSDLGSNWLNYDLRSLNQQLDMNNLSDTTISLYIGSLSDNSPILIADKGDLQTFQDLIRIDIFDEIQSRSGNVFLVINFDSSNDSTSVGSIADETDSQPIVFDFFSFGIKDNNSVNNSIYRFELEESSDNSGFFEGTIEYSVINQLTLTTSALFDTLRPIDNDVKFVIVDRLIDEEGITISYSDLANVGVPITTSLKTDIRTHSGTIKTDSTSYGFGRPVTIILNDPDLNLKHDIIDVYHVINNPNSKNLDSIGSVSGEVLLEVFIKGTKYQRCTVGGIEHGGLGSTGFALVETGPNSGIFEGVFKMPSKICNNDGTELIYTSGGNIDVRYHDFRDAGGESNIVTLSRQNSSKLFQTSPSLNSNLFDLPLHPNSVEVVLTGSIDGHKRGVPVELLLKSPDSSQQNFAVYPTNSGKYKAVFYINSNSPSGQYDVDILYQSSKISTVSFIVNESDKLVDLKTHAQNWSNNVISDNSFREYLRHLNNEKFLDLPHDQNLPQTNIPNWMKHSAKLWSDGLITQDEYFDGIEFLVKKGIFRI